MSIETNRSRGCVTTALRRPPVATSTRRRFLAASVTAGVAARMSQVVRAAEPRFPALISSDVGGKTVRLTLTGAALRTKYLLHVYTVASYAPEGLAIPSPEALATLDAPKQLFLTFERDVDGRTMASSFRESIGRGHPAPAFARELAMLERYFVANPVKVGDRITLTHIPGVGLGVRTNAHPAVVIPSVSFAQAAWGAYFGPHHVGVALKEDLSSRLR